MQANLSASFYNIRDTEDVSPISSRPYSVPITKQAFINEEVQRMLDNKLIKTQLAPRHLQLC